MKPVLFTSLLALSLAVGEVAAVTIGYEAVNPQGAPQRQGFNVIVDERGVAVSPAGIGGNAVIYLAESAELQFVDHAHREYTVMTEEWLREARGKAEQAMQQTRERMEQSKDTMTPQMRSQVQQADAMMRMMPLLGGLFGAGTSQATYSRNGRSAEFNGIPCAQYDELVDGTRTRIVCIGQSADAGVPADAAGMLEDFRQTLSRFGEMGVFDFGFKRPEVMVADALPGIVVAVSYPDGGGFIVSGPASGDDNVTAFGIPDSYLRAEIPMFGM